MREGDGGWVYFSTRDTDGDMAPSATWLAEWGIGAYGVRE